MYDIVVPNCSCDPTVFSPQRAVHFTTLAAPSSVDTNSC